MTVDRFADDTGFLVVDQNQERIVRELQTGELRSTN